MVESCTLLTTEANDLVRPLHERMPVLLDPDDFADWLFEGDAPRHLFRPYPALEMTAKPVSDRLNDARNEGPDLLTA